MSKTKVKMALAKIRAAQQCHPNAVMTLVCEADALMEEALAEQEPAEGRWYRADEIDAFARDIDIALHGDGAAPKPMLCDVMPSLMKMLTEQEQEPIYQLQLLNGNWIDQSKTSYEYNLRNGVVGLRVVYTHPAPANLQASHPIPDDISADLERSDWTAEEALRWYAAGKHYDTVPNGDGTSSARILDNGAVASNALKSMSIEYATLKGDVALAAAPEAPAWQELSKAERKPLTDEQKKAMWRKTDFRGNGGQFDWYLQGIAECEAAHGIGDKV